MSLEFSTNQGRSWSLLHTECLPELCAGPHLPHSTVYSSDNYSGYQNSAPLNNTTWHVPFKHLCIRHLYIQVDQDLHPSAQRCTDGCDTLPLETVGHRSRQHVGHRQWSVLQLVLQCTTFPSMHKGTCKVKLEF